MHLGYQQSIPPAPTAVPQAPTYAGYSYAGQTATSQPGATATSYPGYSTAVTGTTTSQPQPLIPAPSYGYNPAVPTQATAAASGYIVPPPTHPGGYAPPSVGSTVGGYGIQQQAAGQQHQPPPPSGQVSVL